MDWIISNSTSGTQLGKFIYSTREEAQTAIDRLGETISTYYRPFVIHADAKLSRILNEGVSAGDLEAILLPKISIDEYVPSDPDTDHIVVAVFIKGVPEAVYPLKNYIEHCRGVLLSDYGDSDTIPNTSIIYAEFDRDNIRYQDIEDLVYQVGLTASLTPEDFRVSFPNRNKNFPYSIEVVKKYLQTRDREENLFAQEQAIKQRQEELQREIDQEMERGKIGNMLQKPSTEPQAVPLRSSEPRGSPEGSQFLTAPQKQMIRTLTGNGMSRDEVARRVGVSKSSVRKYAESVEDDLTRIARSSKSFGHFEQAWIAHIKHHLNTKPYTRQELKRFYAAATGQSAISEAELIDKLVALI